MRDSRSGNAMSLMGVLALQGSFEEHGNVLQGLGVATRDVRLPRDLDGLDGLIIPGGESTTIVRLLHQWALLEPIRERAKKGLAIWGTCAGAILLAKTVPHLGFPNLQLMDIAVRRNAFGRQVDSFVSSLTVPVLGNEKYPAVFIRAPIITAVEPQVKTLATLQDGTIVAVQQGKWLATSFHPELTQDTRFHRYFVELVKA